MPKKTRPLSGQISLIGGIHQYKLKYHPRITPEGITVLRIPQNALEIDRKMSLEEMRKISGRAVAKPRFYRKQNKLYKGA